jgi:hypothetical protein
LKNELIALAVEDQSLLQSVKEAGELEDEAYHPSLKRLHERNTQRAKEIIERYGWPTISSVGEQGSDAMWLIVQHSVLDPGFMLSCIPILEARVKEGEARGWQLAFLQDRTLMQRGEPQIYGTQHVVDKDGRLVPYELIDPDSVDERRASLGLEPLAERTELLRADRAKVLAARNTRRLYSD